MVALGVLFEFSAAVPNGRLKDHPQWRRPLGLTAAFAGSVGLIFTVGGLMTP